MSAICFSCRIDKHFQSEVNLYPMEKMKKKFSYMSSKNCVELKECFFNEII